MAVERTLSIIKPDAVAKNVIGEIYDRFEKAGLRIVAAALFGMDCKVYMGAVDIERRHPPPVLRERHANAAPDPDR